MNLARLWSHHGFEDRLRDTLRLQPIQGTPMQHARLFSTVPERDYLGFWANQTLQAKSVADFLNLDRHEVARIADVSGASVRWDHKIPQEVVERLTEIAVVCSLVAQFFAGDAVKTALWFKTKNPLLGNLTPRDMIRFGRYDKLRRFVMEALIESGSQPPETLDVEITRERKGGAPKKTSTA
jgi:hypothetical protein